jgi:hypothetical protein
MSSSGRGLALLLSAKQRAPGDAWSARGASVDRFWRLATAWRIAKIPALIVNDPGNEPLILRPERRGLDVILMAVVWHGS